MCGVGVNGNGVKDYVGRIATIGKSSMHGQRTKHLGGVVIRKYVNGLAIRWDNRTRGIV
jgi:hypothetical protein